MNKNNFDDNYNCITSDCCDANPTCDNIDGIGTAMAVCGSGYSLKSDLASVMCATGSCDDSDCCTPNPCTPALGRSYNDGCIVHFVNKNVDRIRRDLCIAVRSIEPSVIHRNYYFIRTCDEKIDVKMKKDLILYNYIE